MSQPDGNEGGAEEGQDDGRDRAWLAERERGHPFFIRLTVRMARLFGRRPLRPIVSVVALWYRLADRRAVRASKDWLTRVHGRPPTYFEVYRHLRTFAQVTSDRIFLMMGQLDAFEFHRSGQEYLQQQVATGRGAVLLGAHIGSYEALRASGLHEEVPIKILGYFKNAQRINQLLDDLDPGQAARVIHIGEDPINATIQARAAVENGELVAIHGDRVGLSTNVVEATFMGEKTLFPAGPFLLASLLRCPVYMAFGLYREPNEYHLYCIPFADRLHLPRRQRQEGLAQVVQDYANLVEEFARKDPYNWFNFFDFWRRP